MARNEFFDPNIVGRAKIKSALHRIDVGKHAVAVRSADPHLLGRRHRHLRFKTADREANAPKPASGRAVEVEEAEMQSRRRGYCYPRSQPRRYAVQHLLPTRVCRNEIEY